MSSEKPISETDNIRKHRKDGIFDLPDVCMDRFEADSQLLDTRDFLLRIIRL